ncbi:hypothetical protein ACGFSB_36120 [Streptomyces sp. NPDC048441]|uniref:hypothetical protein n=1 Tax=Streptomyces sp. NPDC048441 TaxID=3365552 RepID=UPI00371517D1
MPTPRDDTTRHLRKLAALVTQRRVALGLRSKEAAAKACDIAVMTYRKIEDGHTVSDTTYVKIEIGFGFRPGSCKAILGGADSITLENGAELIEGAQIRDFIDPKRLAEAMPQAITKSASVTAPELTLSQVEAMNAGVMEYLRRQGIVPTDE